MYREGALLAGLKADIVVHLHDAGRSVTCMQGPTVGQCALRKIRPLSEPPSA